jgi:hypothetical protein
MLLPNVKGETDLREWLGEWAEIMKDVSIQWVEPAKFGSTTGAADAIVKCGNARVDLELKYLYRTRNGIKFTLRPSQRRYHRMTMIRGGRTSVLGIENGSKRLFLVRGDKVPLRDYASDKDSQTGPDEAITVTVSGASHLYGLLFHDNNYWR